MPVPLDQFVKHLTASGLMTPTEVSTFQESLPPQRRPKDGESLARELVRANKLTKFQAQAVYQGKTKGLVFGEYTVLDRLGAGGMGVVLKAQHRRMKRVVAVKLLPAAMMKSPHAIQRFYREVEAAAKLNHPNIVTAYDAGEHEGVHYLVMEYVEGKDLSAILKEKGPLPVAQAVESMVQAARGLEYAHTKGIVHRDIKPSNLLVDKQGTVKILDMGLARIEGLADNDDHERLTTTGQVMGTCDYMAPEQAFDAHHVDARADIYSLGCTLYRLVTGRVPFQGETLMQVLVAHRESPVPSLCKARPDVPPALDAVCRKMMAKEPAQRQSSMSEVIADLERSVGKRSGAAKSLGEHSSSVDALDQALSFLDAESPRAATVGKTKPAGRPVRTVVKPPPAKTVTVPGGAEGSAPDAAPRRRRAWLIAVAIATAAAIVTAAVMTFHVVARRGGEVEVPVAVKPPVSTPAAASELPPLPIGKWFRLPTDLKSVRAFWRPHTHGGSFGSADDHLEITWGYVLYPICLKNARIRARVKKGPGDHVHLVLRENQHAYYYAKYANANLVEIKCGAAGENRLIKAGRPGKECNDWFVLEFRAEGTHLAFLADGAIVAECQSNENLSPGQVGIAAMGSASIASLELFIPDRESLVADNRERAPQTTDAPPPAVAPFDAAKAKEHQEAWAKHLGVPVELTNEVGMKFVLVPPGEFTMGEGDDIRRVRITKAFYLGKYEVTQEEWEMVMGQNPSRFKHPRYPVESVPWTDCVVFLKRLGERCGVPEGSYRLPTEAQWQYACQAGTTGWYGASSEASDLEEYAWYKKNSQGKQYPVGQRKPNAWGLYDMRGNVMEWCSDWFGQVFEKTALIDPIGPPAGRIHVYRGGSWMHEAMLCRSTYRDDRAPSPQLVDLGFRACLIVADK